MSGRRPKLHWKKSDSRHSSRCVRLKNSQPYFGTIIDQLKTPGEVPPVYARFITAMCAAKPTLIVTTNVDQCLEERSDLPSVLYEDIEQVMRDTYPEGCILKLHGCISATDSLIFTQEDYQSQVPPGIFRPFSSTLVARSIHFRLGGGAPDRLLPRCAKSQTLADLRRVHVVRESGSSFVASHSFLSSWGRLTKGEISQGETFFSGVTNDRRYCTSNREWPL
jgi:SIR2-like domain